MIVSVLLAPVDPDLHGLIAPGLCGAMPPTAYRRRFREGDVAGYEWCATRLCRDLGDALEEALVLAWECVLANGGLDRLDWCRRPHGGVPGRGCFGNYVPHRDDVPDVIRRAYENGWLAAHGGDHKLQEGLGRLVLVDAEGQEVP